MNRLCIALCLLTAANCARPGDHTFSPTCRWTENEHRALNLHNRRDRNHLRHDALAAEDLAIRYATINAGPKSRNFAGFPEYRYEMMACMDALFSGVSNNHSVDIELVREYRLRRSLIADAAVILSCGALYAIIAFWVAGAILQDLTRDDRAAILVIVILTSIGVSTLGVMGVDIWSITIESLRLGSWHLSYRTERIPWEHQRTGLFIAGVLIVWVCAALRYIRLERGRSHPV